MTYDAGIKKCCIDELRSAALFEVVLVISNVFLRHICWSWLVKIDVVWGFWGCSEDMQLEVCR